MKRYVLVLGFILCCLTACGEKIETNMSEKVEAFNFTTQDHQKLSREDLKGEWWIADTIFTNCETVCPPMTRNMSLLQDRIEEDGLDVQLVSFSVDPERDTPEKLKAFGDKYGADYSNWTFLTGYDFQTIKEFSIKSFRNLVDEIPDSEQYMHGTSFFLINPEGKVIKSYTGTSQTALDKIENDLIKVQ